MPPERDFHSTGTRTVNGSNSMTGLKLLKDDFPATEISGRRVDPTGDGIGTDFG
jgi:hypothetical protein